MRTKKRDAILIGICPHCNMMLTFYDASACGVKLIFKCPRCGQQNIEFANQNIDNYLSWCTQQANKQPLTKKSINDGLQVVSTLNAT